MSGRFIGSGRTLEGGVLAARKDDFNSHIAGGDFRHPATAVDINAISGLGGTTVQQALENLKNLSSSSGSGFISIGRVDGYAQGTYNVGATGIVTLYDAFNAAFADPRLVNGGVILVLAGTYTLSTKVTVPPGISIMGEIGGTLIIGETTETSMFLIKRAIKNVTIGGDSGSGAVAATTQNDFEKVRFYNLMLADNFNGTVASGNSSMTTVPMISCEISSRFECDHVTFLGRLNNGAVTGRAKTLAPIGYVTGGGTGSYLKMTDCFMDGFKTGPKFTPGNGNVDNLIIENCRARTYGSEDATVTDIDKNSFIVATACNATITNNYHVGAGSKVYTFLDVIAPASTSAVMMVTGNTGSPIDNIQGNLVYNDTGDLLYCTTNGNNWGIFKDSSWYIVVGGVDTDSPLGDIYGANAINTLFTYSQGSNNFRSTVICNPGTYTVTGVSSDFVHGNYVNLAFIGNKIGKKYPTFQLNVTGPATDSLSQRFLTFGNVIKSIHFTSINRTHSIRPSFHPTGNNSQSPAHQMSIEDCIFTDVSCNLLDIGAGPFVDANAVSTILSIKIEDCDFNQTGTFADTISLVSPPANRLQLKNTYFRGYGYAASLGKNNYTPATFAGSTYVIENVTMDLSNCSIDDTQPGGGTTQNYFVINDEYAKVEFKNTQILCSSSLNARTDVVNATLATTFTKFVSIQCKELVVDNCVFNGPHQTWDFSGILSALPTLWVESRQSCIITNSRFINGCLPLQITGPFGFEDSSYRGILVIENNQIINTDVNLTTTLLDIDLDPTGYSNLTGQISVKNNEFNTAITGNSVLVLHSEQNDSYDAQGIVQIYAPYFDVIVNDNKINGTLYKPAVNPYNHFAGIVVNTYNSTDGLDGEIVTRIQLTNNKVEVVNSADPTAPGKSSASVRVRGTVLGIQNNYIALSNTVGTAIGFAGCLSLDARTTSSYADGIVSGNFFTRRNNLGTTSTLSRGFIRIESTSARGAIVDNSFGDTTYNGTSTDFIDDQTTQPNNWIFERNKNQTYVLDVRGFSGILMNAGDGAGSGLAVGSYPTNVTIRAQKDNTSALVVNFTGSGTGAFQWAIPLYSILPAGVRIVRMDITGQASVALTGGTFTFSLENVGTGTTATGLPALDFTSTSSITSSIVPTNVDSSSTFDNIADNALMAYVTCLQDTGVGGITGSASTITLSAMTITYRW